VNAPRILIVDADRARRVWVSQHVEVLWPSGTPEALEPQSLQALDRALTTTHFDVLLYGVQLTDAATADAQLNAVRELAGQTGTPPIVVLAQGGDEFTAVRAIKAGAFDYLPLAHLDGRRLGEAIRAALAASEPRVPPPRARRADRFELPQYTLLHELGDTTRATVYLAYSSALGRNVALKVSKRGPGAEEQQQFAREYAAISAIEHRSVVEIYDYGFHEGREFLAMEYFPCGDLKTRLGQPLTPVEALDYARRIAEALQIVHGAGLVHRDLKPPNVMLREDGSIVLIDFGLAKAVDAQTHSTVLGTLRGSPYYMSPEHALGRPLDPRSDLYSLGVMLYEMLAGERPYAGDTAMEVMQRHVQGRRPPLPRHLADLEPLIEGLMAREPAQRFTDAAAATMALAATAIGAAAQAAHDSQDVTADADAAATA
jgi:DNA-binding NarL/FixJ family response regulator